MFGMVGQNPKLKARSSSSGGGLRLPAVGPFQALSAPLVSSLSDITLTSGENHYTTSRTSPLICKTFTLSAPGNVVGNNYQFWMWCDTLNIVSGTAIIASNPSFGNINGTNGNIPCLGQGGTGGDGGSGGGGGAATSPPSLHADGGFGGDGDDGGSGDINAVGTGGPGGVGVGVSYNASNPFSLPVGGANSGGDPAGGPWGRGGNGGDSGPDATQLQAGGGAGGGGGLICIVANTINPNGFGGYVQGGNAGTSTGSFANPAQGGGGGVIALFAKKTAVFLPGYFQMQGGFAEGCCSPSASDGNFGLYEIDHAGTSILNSYLNNYAVSWDHS